MALNLKTETVFTDDTPAAQPPLPPEQIAPHFPHLEILECLGRGGMGVVYKARQKTLNRLVALKLLAPERVRDAKFAERFTREAQALAALNHPNIVTIYDFGQAGGFYFLLMEFVDGLNLRQLLRARKFTPEEALAIVPPLCDALQFAHDRGIIHRDIKPENLLLDKVGRVKVADFGIAKMLGTVNGGGNAGESAAPENATQTAVGTPSYSAPEQKTDPQSVDSRADIYSLGVVFYEMLTGELPGKRIEPPSRKVQIDVRLDEVVLRALEQKPELRYQQVSEVKTMVETIVATPDSSRRRGDESQTRESIAKEDKNQSLVTSSPTMFKSERARLAVQEFSGARVKYPVMGEVTLHTDRLVISSGYNQRSIPLADIHGLSEAVMPFWVSPGPHRYAAVAFDEAGQHRHLVFLAGSSMVRSPGDTRLHATEWLTAIQRALKSAVGRDVPISQEPTVVPVKTWRSLMWLPVPLLAAIPFIAKFLLLSKHGSVSFSWINAALIYGAIMLLPVLALFIVFLVRSCSLRHMWMKSLGCATGSAGVAPGRAERELKRGGIVLVGRRNGQRVIVWRGVANTFFAISGCVLITSLLLRFFMPIGTEQMIAFMSLAVLVTAGGVIMGFRAPIEQLTPLDDSQSGSGGRPAEYKEPSKKFIWVACACLAAVLVIGGVQWWSKYEPAGVWIPSPINGSISGEYGEAWLHVTEGSLRGQVVLMAITCETPYPDRGLFVQYSGPAFGFPADIASAETNLDSLKSPTFMSGPGGGRTLVGSDLLKGKSVYQIGFVLPDAATAAKVVEQIKQVHLGKPRGLDQNNCVLELFVLHRRVGEKTNGQPVSENLTAMLVWQPKQNSDAKSKSAAAQKLSFGPVKQVSATTAQIGDIGVYLDCLGTVESSNSVMFSDC